MRRLAPSALFLIVVIAGCNQTTTTPAGEVASFEELPADQIAYGVRTNLTQDGLRRAVLNSDTAYSYESTRKLDLIGVRIVFFNDTGGEAGVLTSNDGEFDQSSNLFVARNDVVLVASGPDGERRLMTNELFFDVGEDELWSDREFTLEENGRTTTGTNFRSDSRFETWSVQGAETSGITGGSEITF